MKFVSIAVRSFTKNWQAIHWIAAITFALFLLWSRFWALDRLPATMPHDEMVYAVQAQSLVLQGRSLDQSQSWWGLKPQHVMYAEWPALVMAPGFLVTDNPLLATHFVSALMGITLPFTLASIVWSLWKRRDVSIATAVVVTLNPLFWQMSRLSYDAFYSLWFYIAAGALLTRNKWYTVALSVPLFFIGFFQYQGFKLLLAPWIAFLLAIMFFNSSPAKLWTKKQLPKLLKNIWALRGVGVLLAGAFALTLYYGIVLLPQQSSVSRLNKLIFTDTDRLSAIVNTERRLSLDNPVAAIASNKGTATLYFMLDRLLGAFDPKLLLMSVEPTVSGFSVWTHGVFYWLEVILFFTGLGILMSKQERRWGGIVYVAGILTLCLPALINSGNEWYLLRCMLSYLLILPVVAWGVTGIWSLGRGWQLALALVYAVSIMNFTYHYWNRFPIISLDWGNFDERIVANYIGHHHAAYPDTAITVFSDEAEYMFWSYLVYNNALNKENADEVAAQMRATPPYTARGTYTVGNITFTSYCAPQDPFSEQGKVTEPQLWIVRQLHNTCPGSEWRKHTVGLDPSTDFKAPLPTLIPGDQRAPVLSFLAVLDSGERFRVYGNQLCSADAGTFIRVDSLDSLRVEQQDAQTFCQQWIRNQALVR